MWSAARRMAYVTLKHREISRNAMDRSLLAYARKQLTRAAIRDGQYVFYESHSSYVHKRIVRPPPEDKDIPSDKIWVDV